MLKMTLWQKIIMILLIIKQNQKISMWLTKKKYKKDYKSSIDLSENEKNNRINYANSTYKNMSHADREKGIAYINIVI